MRKGHIKLLFLALLFFTIFAFSCGKDKATNPSENQPQSSFTVAEIDDLVIYEVNPRALSATGDFQGVVNQLDHIQSLGVNVVWFMPIHPIGQIKSVNSPYSVQNYNKVNPEYGSLDDFKKVVDEAHARNMAVIMDWVANHTAWDNPWIANRSWYTQDGSGQIIHPPGTNWQDVADLNFDSDTMCLAMIDAMSFWLTEIGVDGFRCDAADMVPFDFWQQAIDSLENIDDDLLLLAEGARDDHFDAGFHINYGWHFYSDLKRVYRDGQSAKILFDANRSEYSAVPAGKHMLRFTTNHDESAWDATPVELFGGIDGSLSAFVITTFLQGVPLIYGSQEVGTQRAVSFFDKNPIDWSLNPQVLAHYKALMSIYNESATARSGTLQVFKDPDIVALKKTGSDDQVLIMVNTRNRAVTFALPVVLQNSSWTDVFNDSAVELKSRFSFEPYQYVIAHKQ